jgi:uncharacterized protein with NAD-binding domain and iron-sulfur cluster
MPTQQESEKVAVLGGGPAAIAAAFELTMPDLEGRYEVTVYQPGWRLGGKCASGRNMAAKHGARIEEHGLHIWFGFYDNAFGQMRRAYQELGRPEGHPLRTFADAFKGCDEIVLYERQGEGWVALPFKAPTNPLVPGDADALPGFWDIVKWLCEWALKDFPGKLAANASANDRPAHAGANKLVHDLARYLPGASAQAPAADERLLHLALRLASEAQAHGTDKLPGEPFTASAERMLGLADPLERVVVRLLGDFRDWLWKVIGGACAQDPHLRLYFTMFDTFVSAAKGIVEDEVLEKGWEQINGEDLCEWLEGHGAKQVTLGATPAERSPVLRSIYDVAFGYPNGNIEEANVAAGTAMNDFLRLLFTYRGSLMYKMQAGMGDTVFTPFYEVLARRGVKFKFFQAVTGLHLSADASQIESIDVVEQLDMQQQDYDPIVRVKELECWPSEPVWERLPGGEKLREKNPDFEGELDPLGRGSKPLTLNKDFHHVVLGIPVGALAPICGELAAHHPPFKAMLDAAVTVRTQAFQLWLTNTPQGLGWEHAQDSVAGCYLEPIDTWCDMTHLLAREDWAPADDVAGIAYFCAVLDEQPGESATQASERVKDNALEFLEQHIGPLWPKAIGVDGAMEWAALIDPDQRKGSARLAFHYWRANASPSELYVLTPKGTVQSRLRADESGVSNLYLAGDWTRNGIDGGCVEAAMTSGIQAALALAGTERALSGEDPEWLSARVTGAPSMRAPLTGPGPVGKQPGVGGGSATERVGKT